MYTVYVLFSEKHRKIYIGYSADPIQRLLSHNVLSKKGFTRNYRPWRIVHSEDYPSKTEAIKRERELKSGKGRAWIWELIEKKFPPALDSYPPKADGGSTPPRATFSRFPCRCELYIQSIFSSVDTVAKAILPR